MLALLALAETVPKRRLPSPPSRSRMTAASGPGPGPRSRSRFRSWFRSKSKYVRVVLVLRSMSRVDQKKRCRHTGTRWRPPGSSLPKDSPSQRVRCCTAVLLRRFSVLSLVGAT
ncbi:hypothetical protein CI102_2053 [Trichoderma harzianum]|uniref:Uncharacterized protein n=1 Tax=Trichoderma harzianum CBS 226.95 TaxID=983964 RepID=A0A2T4A3P2_TRIHA|nr:hypothetical protein M431DRAFT_225413 [Trichoderma harzianum CBS 226.95]PKK53570.1 hypothetical protein CI102_2053 [Trichoderma harzianum]PTB51692.1 hypothetical protein M431DRAFT_225413 [Trichoderma harzianum CBS 226.95]